MKKNTKAGKDNLPQRLITFTKIQKSNNREKNHPTIIKLSFPYENHSHLVFEHVLHQRHDKYPRRERYRGGGFAVIKMAFSVEDKEFANPICAVKIMTDGVAAEREFTANFLLGRFVLWAARNGKHYIFTPWINGVTLSQYINQLNVSYFYNTEMTYPFYEISKRKDMFSDYLKQVNILHKKGLILCDPKTSNVMVDFDNSTLVLIDLDAVHSKSIIGWGYTSASLPPNLSRKSFNFIHSHYSQKDDIYILGKMLYQFFPEIEDEKNHISQHLSSLVNDMTHRESNLRISTTQCLERLEGIPQEERALERSESSPQEEKGLKLLKSTLQKVTVIGPAFKGLQVPRRPNLNLFDRNDISGKTIKENVITFANYTRELGDFVTKNQPTNLPFYDMEMRLQMFLNFCETVKKTHENKLSLLDPKNKCILDSKNQRFILDKKVDYHQYKNHHLPPNLISYHCPKRVSYLYCQADDIYILGIMLAELFPEYYQVKFNRIEEEKSPEIKWIQNQKFPKNQSFHHINHLVGLMVKRYPGSRPSISNCIGQLNQIKNKVQLEFPKSIVEEKSDDEKYSQGEFLKAIVEIISSFQSREKKLRALSDLSQEWIKKFPSNSNDIRRIHNKTESRIYIKPINFGYRCYENLYRKIPTNEHLIKMF